MERAKENWREGGRGEGEEGKGERGKRGERVFAVDTLGKHSRF